VVEEAGIAFSSTDFPQQLLVRDWVCPHAAGPLPLPKEIIMFTAGLNALAFRFGGFRFGHGGGGFGFVVLFLILAGAIIWAVSRPSGAESQKS
jgi:hypothetical protein